MNGKSVRHLQVCAIVSLAASLLGCGNSVPSPTDPDVMKTTLEICEGLIRDQLIESEGPKYTGMTIQAMQLFNGIAPKYAAWNDVKGQHESIKETIESIDETMRSLNLSLHAIRVLSKKYDIGRTEFAAELHLGNGKKIDITGSVQYTEDGMIYVEVEMPR